MGNVDITSVALLVLGGVGSILLALIKSKLDKMDKTAEEARDELAKFKLQVAVQYASKEDTKELKDDLKELETVITSSFRNFGDKLDVIQEVMKKMSDDFRDRLDRKQDRN